MPSTDSVSTLISKNNARLVKMTTLNTTSGAPAIRYLKSALKLKSVSMACALLC